MYSTYITVWPSHYFARRAAPCSSAVLQHHAALRTLQPSAGWPPVSRNRVSNYLVCSFDRNAKTLGTEVERGRAAHEGRRVHLLCPVARTKMHPEGHVLATCESCYMLLPHNNLYAVVPSVVLFLTINSNSHLLLMPLQLLRLLVQMMIIITRSNTLCRLFAGSRTWWVGEASARRRENT